MQGHLNGLVRLLSETLPIILNYRRFFLRKHITPVRQKHVHAGQIQIM
jgi:hypothetical protein